MYTQEYHMGNCILKFQLTDYIDSLAGMINAIAAIAADCDEYVTPSHGFQHFAIRDVAYVEDGSESDTFPIVKVELDITRALMTEVVEKVMTHGAASFARLDGDQLLAMFTLAVRNDKESKCFGAQLLGTAECNEEIEGTLPGLSLEEHILRSHDPDLVDAAVKFMDKAIYNLYNLVMSIAYARVADGHYLLPGGLVQPKQLADDEAKRLKNHQFIYQLISVFREPTTATRLAEPMLGTSATRSCFEDFSQFDCSRLHEAIFPELGPRKRICKP